MSKVPEWFLQELRQKVDIVEVITEHVQLRRSGRSFTGLCPFHNERTPSFSVSPDRQMYHCFGCGAGGTVIQFVMEIEAISFVDAVISLATRAGMEIPETVGDYAGRQPNPKNQRHKDAHELATKLYSYILMNRDAGVQALSYLENRGISRKSMTEFRLGFAPNTSSTVVKFLKSRGFEEAELVEFGLAVEMGVQTVDRFRGRVMIPIFDKKGFVIAFGGRALDKNAKPKYLNSPENDLFHKSNLLYPFHMARKAIRQEGSALLLEGYMDVISLAQAGLANGIASLGTSLTEQQAHLLKVASDEVVIAYDGDDAGRKATIRAIDVLTAEGVKPSVLRLPDGVDPDEFVHNSGGDAFRRLLARRKLSIVQFLLDDMRVRSNLVSPAGRTEFIRDALQLLAERATPVEQEYELRSLSQEFNLSVETLKEELRTFAKQSRDRWTARKKVSERDDRVKPLEPAVSKASINLLRAALFHADSALYMMESGVTELAEPVQTILLARLYDWRLRSSDGVPESFVDELDDESLIHVASSLFFGDVPEFTHEVLDDYIKAIERHRLEAEYRRLLRAWIESEEAGDESRTTEIKLQVEEIQRQIAALKTLRPILG